MTPPGPGAYRHLLLTKFNILTNAAYGPSGRRLEDGWLRARLEEFETFCLPSVRGQVGADFTWVVFCDDESPEWFKKRMRSFGDVLTPLFVSGMTNATMGAVLRDAGLVDRPWLISTRLDNDDALRRTFLRDVQRQFAGQQRLFVEFRLGLRAYRGGLHRAYWRSNPFLSLIEAVGPDGAVDVVYLMNHRRVLDAEPTRVVWGRPAWLRSLHPTNTVLTPVGLPLLASRHPDFACDWDRLPAPRPLPVRAGWSVSGGVQAWLVRSRWGRLVARALRRGR